MTSSLRSNVGSAAQMDKLAKSAPASKPKAIKVSARFMNRSPVWRTSMITRRRAQHNRQPAGRRRGAKKRNGNDAETAADCNGCRSRETFACPPVIIDGHRPKGKRGDCTCGLL